MKEMEGKEVMKEMEVNEGNGLGCVFKSVLQLIK